MPISAVSSLGFTMPPRFGKTTGTGLFAAKPAGLTKVVTNPHSDLRLQVAYFFDKALDTGDRLMHNDSELRWTKRRIPHLSPKLRTQIALGIGKFRFRDPQLPLLQTLLKDEHPSVYEAALRSVRYLSRPKTRFPHSAMHREWAKLKSPISGDPLGHMAEYYKSQAPADRDLLNLVETAVKNPLASEYSEAAQKRRAFLASRVMGVRTTQFTHVPALLGNQLKTKTELHDLLERQVNLMTQLAYAQPNTVKVKPLFWAQQHKSTPSVLDKDPAIEQFIPYETQMALLTQRVQASPIEPEAKVHLAKKLDDALAESAKQLRMGA